MSPNAMPPEIRQAHTQSSHRRLRTDACGISALLLSVAMAPGAAADESMRCGNWIVEAPISAQDLLSKCGPPLRKEVTTEDVRAAGRNGGSRAVGTTTVERWTYKADSQALAMVATVIDGQVTKLARAE